jgi:hypothetical protein
MSHNKLFLYAMIFIFGMAVKERVTFLPSITVHFVVGMLSGAISVIVYISSLFCDSCAQEHTALHVHKILPL